MKDVGGYVFERVVPHTRNSVYAEVKFTIKDLDINAIDLLGHFLDFLRGSGYSDQTVMRALSEHMRDRVSADKPKKQLPDDVLNEESLQGRFPSPWTE